MQSTAMNILENNFWWAAVLIWFECPLKGGNAGSKNGSVFQKVVTHFAFPPAVYENFSCTISLTTLCIFDSFFIFILVLVGGTQSAQ